MDTSLGDNVQDVMTHLRQLWSSSRVYRAILVVALVYTGLRLIVHGAYLGMMLYPGSELMGGMPEWTGSEGEPMVPPDLQIYLDAARHFQQRQDLYLKGSLARLEDHYPYAPPFALAFVPFLWLSPVAVSIVHSLLHIAAYVLLFVSWGCIFSKLGFDRAGEVLALSTPLWLVFSAFWGDMGYLNIYLIMTLLGTLYIEAVITERLGRSLVLLSAILQIKPHWAFATAVPLLLRRYRYFFKLLAMALLSYLIIAGMTALIAGPNYTVRQYTDYIAFLSRLSRDFPWRGPDSGFLGYNHSIKQVVFYALGRTSGTAIAATLIKILLLTPLGMIAWRLTVRSCNIPSWRTPQLALDLAFALYLGAFIWLDMVWEASLAIAIFVYLLTTLKQPWARILTWVVFLPYALIDAWQLLSLGLFGMDVIAPGPYVLTDPSIYIPMIMILILTFYALLIRRVWKATPMVSLARA
jgi:hypothetical protein